MKSKIELIRHLNRVCVGDLFSKASRQVIHGHSLPYGPQRVAYYKTIIPDMPENTSNQALVHSHLFEEVETISEGLYETEHQQAQKHEGTSLWWRYRQGKQTEEGSTKGLRYQG